MEVGCTDPSMWVAEDLEVHLNMDAEKDRRSVAHCRLKAVLAHCFDGFLVETVPDPLHDRDCG